MVDSVVSAAPFVPVKPAIRLIDGSNSIQFQCAAGELAVEVDQDESTTETFCGTYTTYKAEVWTATVTAFPSYGSAGLWNAVRPYVGKPITFEILPDASKARGADNPLMSGTCYVKAFPFYTGSPGEPTSFDIVLSVQGVPTFTTTAGAAATSGVAGAPGFFLPLGATPPANAAGATAGGVTAQPTSAWTSGQYVAGSSADMYWNGSAWTAGRAP